jgi:Mce-associated membrane protein
VTAEETTEVPQAPKAGQTSVAEEVTEVEATEHAEATVHPEPKWPKGSKGAAEQKRHDDEGSPGRLSRVVGRVKQLASGRIAAALTGLLVVASLSVLVLLFIFWYRPDQATDAAAAKAAVSAASDGAVAILSYTPETLDHDFSSAKSHLTGDFLSYYDQFTRQIVAPAAKQKAVKTSAVVLRAALSELHPDSAVVLLFVNQSTQSAGRPEPTLTSSSVVVTLKKADGNWLISQFNPV